MIIRLFYAIFLLPFIVCAFEEPHYCKLSDNVTDQHIREMKHRGFNVLATGGGFMDDINLISIRFKSEQQINLEQARRLFVKGAQDLLNGINQDSAIQPYLHHRPFILSDLDYSLAFPFNPNLPEIIACVYNIDNEILYTTCFWDSERGHKGLKVVHRESFEDAIKIVQASEQPTQPVNSLTAQAK